MKTFNSRGSVAVESAISLLAVIAIITAGFTAGYISFARVWIERASYEAAVCLSTSALQSFCEKEIKESSAQTLPVGQTEVTMRRTSKQASVVVRFLVHGQEIFKHTFDLKLPLHRKGALR